MDKSHVGIEEAARQLGVSTRTIRRWIHRGKLPARKLPKGDGYVYLVDVTGQLTGQTGGQVSTHDGRVDTPNSASASAVLTDKDRLIETLREEIAEKNRQIGEILLVLRQTQALLPEARSKKRWWWPFGRQ